MPESVLEKDDSFYLHGPSFGKSYAKVLPLPVLLHQVGKDDMSVSAGPGQLGAIRRPGQVEHAACVGFLQRVGPLEGEEQSREKQAHRFNGGAGYFAPLDVFVFLLS